VNQDLAMTTRYAAIDPLYDTWEAPDVLLKLTEIIHGKENALEDLTKSMEALTGMPAKQMQDELKRLQAAGQKSPFSAACRKVAINEAAKRVHVTPEEFDKVLREKGVYHEENWRDLLKHAAVPHEIPAVTASGRIEFFSSLFELLRSQGNSGAYFNVLAGYIPTECRPDKTMDQALGDDEFYFAYGKVPTVSYGSTNSNNPVLAAINTLKKDIYMGVWMHPERADKLGIKTGDKIHLTNTASGQQTDGHAYVTRKVRPDTLFLHSAFGVENKQLTRSFAMGGTAVNKLIPHTVEPVVAGFRSQEFTIRVKRA